MRATRTELFESVQAGTQSTELEENGGSSDNPITEICHDIKIAVDGGLEVPNTPVSTSVRFGIKELLEGVQAGTQTSEVMENASVSSTPTAENG